MPAVRRLSFEEQAEVRRALAILGVPADAQFIGLAWGMFTRDGTEDWQAESVILTPDADPFLARVSGLALTRDILEGLFAGITEQPEE